MAGNRTLKLSILADVDDLKKKLNQGSDEVEGFGGKLEKFGKVAGAAFAAATVAAAAYAGKLAIDGVKAAIDDEAAQQRLANALRNVTGATDAQIKSVEDQILKMSLSFGVADEKLRPAFQRLSIATGDLTKSNDLLKLAMDISAATGKDLETVSNALGKAYEGNTGALARLGVGLSSTELKSMSLDEVTKQLSDTFGGAATTQAETFEGQIARLKVGFDEAKESVGTALLPIVQTLLDFIVNTAIPKFQEFKDKAIQPVINAFNANKDSLTTLYNFVKDFVIPIFINGLGAALEFIGKVAAGVLTVIGKIVEGVKGAISLTIDGINAIITAYNAIPFLPNISTISKPNWVTGSNSSAPSIPTVEKPTISIPNVSTTSSTSTTTGVKAVGTATSAPVSNTVPTITTFNPGAFRIGEEASIASLGVSSQSNWNPSPVVAAENSGITINVMAPTLLDKEGFSRAVVDALNESNSRLGGGGSGIRFGTNVA